MRKILKFNKQEGKYVFLSDLHFGHDKEFLWGARNFKSQVEHDKFIIDNWKQHIDEKTTVFNLGDVFARDDKMNKFDTIAELPCKDHFILFGNHNSGVKQAYAKAHELFFENLGVEVQKDVEVYPLKYKNITFVGEDLCIRFGKLEIHLSHFPKRVWDHMARESLHLSGHSHGNDSGRNLDAPNGKCLDVGVENAMKNSGNMFFSLDEITQILQGRDIQLLDHHTPTTNPSR